VDIEIVMVKNSAKPTQQNSIISQQQHKNVGSIFMLKKHPT